LQVIRQRNTTGLRLLRTIRVGTEPYGLALTPNGTKLYVTNARSNNVSVIDTRSNRVLKTIENAGFEPRGIAISNDDDGEDDDEIVLVSQFLALPIAGKLDGEDDSKVGMITVIRTVSDEVQGTVELKPLKDTGFNAAGDAIGRIAPPATPVEADFKFVTGAYPNQLNNLAIKGNFVYIPNTGASPNGPIRFDVNTQSLLSVMDIYNNADAGRTINMHLAVKNQTATPRLFLTQPWAIAFKHLANEAYVLSSASNVAAKIRVDPNTGAPEVLSNPSDAGRVLQIPTGKNPRGIVINATDSRAYIMNYISRDVTVVDLAKSPETVVATMQSAVLPAQGSFEDLVLAGKELYNTSVGEFDAPNPFSPAVRGRMSNNGWGSCASCHPNGWSDNVVWIFGSGPRRTIPQFHDFDRNDPSRQRVLNWSGIFDEEEDFELNIRGTSGGAGLLIAENGSPDNPVAAFTPANANRRQLAIRGFGAWDAIKAYIQFGIRTPISPVDKYDPDVIAGEQLFRQANCQSCHGGPQWTSGILTHTPPPSAELISNGQVIGVLRKVGTFNPDLKTEVRATAVAPLGADGYVPPSLLSLFAFPKTFFHNGTAESLDAVMENVTHRTAGTGGSDLLPDAEQRRKVVRFLLSIDADTPPIDPQ
jgi:YVTN family beta-propeller protein